MSIEKSFGHAIKKEANEGKAMVQKKTHTERSGCPVACALDIVGDHWTLLVVRNLMFLGLHEYKEMLAESEGISSNILSDRLKRLEQNRLIASMTHPESRKRKLYYLTDKGKDLIFTMVQLILWAEKHLSDQLEIPPEKKELLVNDPDRFIELTLMQLQEWEEANLITFYDPQKRVEVRMNKSEIKKAYKQSKRPMGVYRITNTQDDNVYLGYSTDLKAIFNRHRAELRFKTHRNKELQKKWDSYGESAFEFEILDVVEKKEDTVKDPREDMHILAEMWSQRLRETGATVVHL